MSGHYLSAARSAALSLDFCLVGFYFIFFTVLHFSSGNKLSEYMHRILI